MDADRRIKVLIISSMTKFSGGEICIFRIIQNNDELIPLFVLPKGGFSDFLEKNHISTAAVNTLLPLKNQKKGSRITTFIKNLRAIYLHAKKEKSEIIIANGTGLGFFSGIIRLVTFQKTIVIHHHPVLSSTNFIRYVLHHLIVLINSKTIAVSNSVKHSYLSWPIFQNKIIRIYNGIDPAMFFMPPGEEVLIQKEPGIVNIGLVATITSWKGHLIALKAISQLIELNFINVKLFFIGEILNLNSPDFDYYKQLQEYIYNNEIKQHVVFTGKISNPSDIYSNLDIVLNCSTEPEPFGTTIYEAMGFGKIVVGSNLGGTPEIIADGLNGYLYNSEDFNDLAQKLAFAIKNPDDKLRENAQKFVVDNLGIYIAQKNYNGVIKRLLKNQSPKF